MRIFLILIITSVLLQTQVSAQDIDFLHFKTLQSAGKIPEDFTRLSSEKYFDDIATLEGSNKKEIQDKQNFLLESNFIIDEMLHSGRVVFGDPVTNYLNKIKDEILSSNPQLADEIRIYTLLSNDVNAFTADNGIILVTTGLIAQVQNEAQIAFILCHEFVHYYEKHAIDNFVENRKIDRGIGVYASLDNDEVDLEKFRYSKDLETEADVKGMEYFKKTKYSVAAIEGVFDVLLYSYLPFDEVTFPKNYFNDDLYVLPDNYFLDTLASITAEEDYDDEESTHPNIKKRKSAIINVIDKFNDADRQTFINTEAEFNYIQKICRYQGCEMYLYDIAYEDALYQAFLLQQDDADNAYLKEIIAQALYGLSMYKNAGSTPDWHRYYKKVEGESQQVFHIFYRMNAKELNTLALKYAWEVHLASPENVLLNKICTQLGYEMVNQNSLNTDDFFDAQKVEKLKAEVVVAVDTASITTENKETEPIKTTKYDKIKKEKSPTTTKEDKEKAPYWKYAFPEFLDDKNFTALFVKEEEEEETSKKKKSDNDENEFHLGLNEIVMVDPVYFRVDERSDNPVQYQAAETAKEELRVKVKENADDLNLKVKYLDYHSMGADDVDAFNDLSVLNRWLNEKISHLDEDVYMNTSTNDEFLALSQKYDITNFTWMGIVSFTEPESYVGAKIFLCIYLPLAPFLIYDLVTPDRATFYFALVADAETGKFIMQYYNSNRLRDSDAVKQSNIYFILQQIKSKKK